MALTDSISAIPQFLISHNRLSVAVGTAAVVGTLIVPSAYRDYRTFISYGASGVPINIFGWIYVRTVMQPLGREMLSTELYERRMAAAEGHGKGDEGFLDETQLEDREGERPVIGPHVVPQRQLTQLPDERVREVRIVIFFSFLSVIYVYSMLFILCWETDIDMETETDEYIPRLRKQKPPPRQIRHIQPRTPRRRTFHRKSHPRISYCAPDAPRGIAHPFWQRTFRACGAVAG